MQTRKNNPENEKTDREDPQVIPAARPDPAGPQHNSVPAARPDLAGPQPDREDRPTTPPDPQPYPAPAVGPDTATPPRTLPRTMRLRGKTAVDTLFREGRGGFVYPFRYVIYEGEVPPKIMTGEEGFRVLFSVPKRYHKRANKRNLLRRRTKEAFRQARHQLSGLNRENSKEIRIALIYSSKEIEDYRKIDKAVRRIIGQVRETLTRD